MTLASAAFNLGGTLGPVVGGWIGTRLGLREVYLLASGVYLISTLFLLPIASQLREGHVPGESPTKLVRDVHFISFLSVAFLVMFVMYVPQPLTPNFLHDQRHLSLAMIGWLGAAGSLGNAVLNIVLGQFVARTGFLLAQLSAAMFSILIWKGSGIPAYTLGYFMLGGYRASRPLIYAQVRALIPPAQMGLAYGITEAFNSLATVLAPLLAGVVYTHGPELVYPVSLALGAVALLVSLLFTPRGAAAGPPILTVRSLE
jgi:MFS family permease